MSASARAGSAPGIPGEVLESQRVFRRLLEATARPGVLIALPPASAEPETAVLRALLDHEVSFGVVGGAEEEAEGIRLTTGARGGPARRADFVLVRGGDSGGEVAKMKRGTLWEPHLGATAIYAVGRLSARGPVTLALSGPGVEGSRTLGVDGLAASEVGCILESRADYPMGVDVYLVDGAGLVGALPRSTRVETAAGA